MEKKLKVTILVIVIALLCICLALYSNDYNKELKSIKSTKMLSQIYEKKDFNEIFVNIIAMPFSFFEQSLKNSIDNYGIEEDVNEKANLIVAPNETNKKADGKSTSNKYSTTNIQVENVDEADITKTDGNYIYSISKDNVIITNVTDPKNIKIEAKIESLKDEDIPEDLILYKNKLVVIYTDSENLKSYTYRRNTIVKVYDITKKSNPVKLKEYELYEPYYTSRCIDGKLYVIASGNLRKEEGKDGDIITYYKENGRNKDIGLNNIKYLKDIKTNKQTLISFMDLNNPKESVNVKSYLMNIENAYVSENNIYLLNEKYDRKKYPIKTIFGAKGIFGFFEYLDNSSSSYSGKYTEIYKFNILKSGDVSYDKRTKVEGTTINQYSLDELKEHLRIALHDSNGAKVVVFDENLNEIGRSKSVAKGEKMYASRFIGDKVYLVTYKTIDPLFVIDLSDEKNPEVLGELKIPGYSTYLHPYDENHLIGIGMETEEVTRKDSNGRVTSTSSYITGMKMALFDVSDVKNPIQISSTVIGDKRATSAILDNPKALLFSKEKGFIAIPVNNYKEDFKIKSDDSSYLTEINSYKERNNQSYVSEGYFVYNIDIKNGFNLKGVITHETSTTDNYYNIKTKLLRGLYIDNNLYTVSEIAIKVNDLENLKQISELKIK